MTRNEAERRVAVVKSAMERRSLTCTGTSVTADNHVGIMLTRTIPSCVRVAPGLSLRSQAARCAEIFGIPHELVERAQHVRSVPYEPRDILPLTLTFATK